MSETPREPIDPFVDGEMRAKHRARALQALANHRCVTDLTDGFCGPRDGKCQRPGDRRDCVSSAAALLAAIESSGMVALWVYDPRLLAREAVAS